jgi:hypothetical protein
MNFRDMNLAVFQGKPLPHVFWQPRFEPWYAWHQTFKKMPRRYEGMSLLDLYDYCHASMRTVHYYTGMPDPIVRSFDSQVKIHHKQDGARSTVVFETPHGPLTEQHEHTIDDTWREVGFPVKDRQDLIKLRWLFQHMTWSFSPESFDKGERYVGPRGAGSFWVPKSPYQALAQQWMKLEDLIYALADCPDVVEDTMKAIDDSYDRLYEQLAASQVKVINFGENIHEQLLSPAYWERYMEPFFAKRCAQLRTAGIFTHVHIDGYFKHMLPYLKRMPHDGIEALTPLPQGDMTLEEIKQHIGDKVLLDGIPAVLFLPDLYTRDQLMECVEKVVKLFHPRLILGVSDEVPQGAGEEAIERVKMIGQWCQQRSPSQQ